MADQVGGAQPGRRSGEQRTAALGATEKEGLREEVRRRYAQAATAAGEDGCGCGGTSSPAESATVFGEALYGEQERQAAPLEASLGCGNPTAVADLREGEVVLDLGSGAGGDVLLSARRVGPRGKAYGLDMTEEMIALARSNADDAGLANVEFLKGEIEQIPLADGSVDVVISNCVINLSVDKPAVLREASRVLRPGGRFAIADVIADEDMDEETRRDMREWTGCIAGALTEAQFRTALEQAGFDEVEIVETHRVHESAASAIVRARKSAAAGDGPLACSLTAGDMADRQAELRAIFDGRLIEAVREDGALRLALRDSPGLEERVAHVIELERACCPFLDLALDREDGRLIVQVAGPPEARAVIDVFEELVSAGRRP